MPRSTVSCTGAPAIGVQWAGHLSLTCSALISGGLCGLSADHTSRENSQGCATEGPVSRAALPLLPATMAVSR